MIDSACIFTTGGVVLYSKNFVDMKFDPIDVLIKKVLVHEKNAETQHFIEPYIVKWQVAKEQGIIFAVVYQEIFQLLYIEEHQSVTRKKLLRSDQGKVGKMLMVYGVKLVLRHQSHEVREFQSDDATRLEQNFHPGDKIIYIRYMCQHVVTHQQVRRMPLVH